MKWKISFKFSYSILKCKKRTNFELKSGVGTKEKPGEREREEDGEEELS